jgi:hypothetical protein
LCGEQNVGCHGVGGLLGVPGRQKGGRRLRYQELPPTEFMPMLPAPIWLHESREFKQTSCLCGTQVFVPIDPHSIYFRSLQPAASHRKSRTFRCSAAGSVARNNKGRGRPSALSLHLVAVSLTAPPSPQNITAASFLSPPF